MHRIPLYCAVSAVCLSLLACGSGGGSTAPTTTTPTNTTSSEQTIASSSSAAISSVTSTPVTSSLATISSIAISSSSRAAYDGTLAGTAVEAPNNAYKVSPVTLTRLNRTQYNNTVRDLFGTTQTPADNFPEDDFGDGFNSIGNALSISALHLEQYHQAAEALVSELVTQADSRQTSILTAPLYDGYEHIYGNGYVSNWDNSEITVNYTPPNPGRYRITIDAIEYHVGSDFADAYVAVNGAPIHDESISGSFEVPQSITVETYLQSGSNALGLGFSNAHDVATGKYRGIGVREFIVEGPLENTASGQFNCNASEANTDCAERILHAFMPKAWRRPISSSEHTDILGLYTGTLNDGGNHKEALGTAITGVLLSPYFIYRPELASATGSEPTPLTAHELAARLSYFLWSTLPDASLSAAADDGSLLDDAVLESQIERMLTSPNADALIENFAVQWLKFDKILEASPNPQLFPTFDAELVEAMRQETRLFVAELIHSNAPLSTLFTADFTFINNRLAQHYGISGNFGSNFERYQWQDGDRQGILGQASVLTATAHPSSTSPVKRGVWVLENLLCQEPPPPPPGVENIADNESLAGLTTRERFARHSEAGSSCRACHTLMDPIGFGLENYNPVGQWRDYDGDNPVDASSILPVSQDNGVPFNGAWQLGQLLASSPRLPLCVSEHLLTYALSQGVHAFTYGQQGPDYALVHDIYTQTLDGGHRFGDMIKAIILSPAFRQSVPPASDDNVTTANITAVNTKAANLSPQQQEGDAP